MCIRDRIKEELDAKKLKGEFSKQAHSNDVAKGLIIDNVPSDTYVDAGTLVVFTLSLGREDSPVREPEANDRLMGDFIGTIAKKRATISELKPRNLAVTLNAETSRTARIVKQIPEKGKPYKGKLTLEVKVPASWRDRHRLLVLGTWDLNAAWMSVATPTLTKTMRRRVTKLNAQTFRKLMEAKDFSTNAALTKGLERKHIDALNAALLWANAITPPN